MIERDIISNIYCKHKVTDLIKIENSKIWHKHHQNDLAVNFAKNMSLDHCRTSLQKHHSYNARNKKIMNLPRADNK